MNSLHKTASTLILAAAAFSNAAQATNDTYYPEYPVHNGSTHHNNYGDTNTYNTTNSAQATAQAAANAAAIAAQRQAQHQAQQQTQQQTANGGAGGNGGNGGNGYGGSAEGGHADAHATGGNGYANGGNSGGNVFSTSTNVKAPLPMGNVAAAFINPTGECGDGWALNLSGPFAGIGGGSTSHNTFCLSQEAAMAAINAGIVAKDTGMVATGLAGLRQLHTEFDTAAKVVVDNLMKPCAAQAAKISAIMLTQSDLKCSGNYVAGTEAFVRTLQTPVVTPVVVPAAPLRVEIINTVPVAIEGTVKTKEVRPAVVHHHVKRHAAVVTPKPACDCK